MLFISLRAKIIIFWISVLLLLIAELYTKIIISNFVVFNAINEFGISGSDSIIVGNMLRTNIWPLHLKISVICFFFLVEIAFSLRAGYNFFFGFLYPFTIISGFSGLSLMIFEKIEMGNLLYGLVLGLHLASVLVVLGIILKITLEVFKNKKKHIR